MPSIIQVAIFADLGAINSFLKRPDVKYVDLKLHQITQKSGTLQVFVLVYEGEDRPVSDSLEPRESNVNDVSYAVYFNKWNPHVRIHKVGCCNHVGKNADPESHGEMGGWKFFENEAEALEYAKAMAEMINTYDVGDCVHCRNNGWR